MPSEQKAQTPSQPSLPGIISPGMAALLRGDKSNTPEATEKLGVRLAEYPGYRRLPVAVRLSLFSADILLCGLVLGWTLTHGGPVTLWHGALCIGAIILGAWLSVLALWL